MLARPNDAGAIAGHIQGLREVKAAFQALPQIVREHLNDATELTLRELVRHAKINLERSPSIRTRALLNNVGWTLNRKSGRGKAGVSSGSTTLSNSVMGGIGRSIVRVKGIVIAGRGGSALTSQGATLIRPSRYAHLVEFGTRHASAEPFMMPAAESQKQPYLERCRAQGPKIERDAARIGGGERLL